MQETNLSNQVKDAFGGAKRRLSGKNIFAGVSVLLFIGFLASGFILMPKIATLRQNISDTKEEVARLDKRNKILRGFSRQAGVLREQQLELDKALPPELDIADYMGRVSQVATNSAVSVGSFNFSPGSSRASLRRKRASKEEATSFLLEVSGKYDALLNFIDKLANFASLSSFNQFAISADQESSTLQLKGALRAFYLPREERLANLESINLKGKDYQRALQVARDLVSWSVGNYPQKTGRSNPFSR